MKNSISVNTPRQTIRADRERKAEKSLSRSNYFAESLQLGLPAVIAFIMISAKVQIIINDKKTFKLGKKSRSINRLYRRLHIPRKFRTLLRGFFGGFYNVSKLAIPQIFEPKT